MVGLETEEVYMLLSTEHSTLEFLRTNDEEFRSSMPLALELDPTVYGQNTVTEVPVGSYKYEPGVVPTLML